MRYEWNKMNSVIPIVIGVRRRLLELSARGPRELMGKDSHLLACLKFSGQWVSALLPFLRRFLNLLFILHLACLNKKSMWLSFKLTQSWATEAPWCVPCTLTFRSNHRTDRGMPARYFSHQENSRYMSALWTHCTVIIFLVINSPPITGYWNSKYLNVKWVSTVRVLSISLPTSHKHTHQHVIC